MDTPEDEQVEVQPSPEPAAEPHEHLPPLESDDDARFLDPVDPRRREVERRLGRSLEEDED